MTIDVLRLINALWILAGVYWALTALRAKRVVRKEQYASRVLHIAVMCIAFDLLFGSAPSGLLGARYLPNDAWIAWTGFALAAAGLAFAVWARTMLGANWSGTVAIKSGHELVRTGPYAWVRHPIYSGLLLAILGTALALGEIRGPLAFLVALLGWGIKSILEERFLIDQFDADYVRYSSEVKRLIPFVF
jgi:protein-S-isoprenylcysteine O-methyltransferase Ste14